jgi:hypothetical protein
MNENSTNILLTIELLAARLFHDFANSMSGIMFGVEEFESGNVSTQNEAFSLIKEGFSDLLIKYNLMKQAYSMSDSNSCFNHTRSNVENYLLKKK